MAKKVVRNEPGKKVTRDNLGAGLRAVFSADKLEEAIELNQDELVNELMANFLMIPIEQIEGNINQPRKDFTEVELNELADSIKTHGIIQPITVRRLEPKKYQIISGERRFRASKLAELTEIPAYILKADDTLMLEMAILENIKRQDLNPMELANSYARLISEFHLTHEQLSERLGVNRPSITNFLRLINLQNATKAALRDGLITLGHGKVLAGIEFPSTELFLLQETIENGLSVKALETLRDSINAPKTKKSAGKSKDLPEEYQAVRKKIRATFGIGSVQLKVNAEGKGQVVIPFANTKALNELLDILDRLEENH
ncbi:ParB/RepB/Spo0J family partition protein [Haliscomenobacter sp.]|uniref:ParB/RepB/Spo0J family partition protein n=1 Tax=Haliscomenobacter sp. TaxID=2717303 RepID=UPI0035934F2C